MHKNVGMIGMGLLGSALAERLLGGGFSVLGYDVQPAATLALREAGGQAAASAVEVAATCERLLLSLPDSTVVGRVLDEIGSALKPGSIVIDTTTGAPEDAECFAARLQARGVCYLDATVGGSSRQARRGEALLMCGGDERAYQQCLDLFACCGRQTFFVGPSGSGARMKLVTNLVLGLTRAVLAEGLEYARACGLAPELALEILKAGPAYSRPMDVKGQKMLSADFTPEARLSQHLKDVRLILSTGERCGAHLPLSALHETLLAQVEAAGYGGADNSAIIQAFRKDSRS
jgi:3-hydroxyisobutyrate dehydrogenase-like beta-hydroxyacid dehydrogenase